MSQFVQRRLTDLLSFIVDNRGRTCPTAETGIPLIATNCVKDDELYPVFEKVRFVDEATYETWFRAHPEPGDILFVCKGSPGRTALVPDPVSFCIAQDMVALRADSTIIDNRYLYYVLQSQETRHQIENMHVGTMIPHFKKGDFPKLVLSIHADLGEQHAIAAVLGALDDKIAANTKFAVTVDSFLAALFRQLTQDASVIPLGETATVNPATSKPVPGGSLRYIDISSVGQGTFDFPDISAWDDAPSRARRHVQSGDTLWSTVRPNRRSHALVLSDDDLLVGSTGLAILRPREVGFAYLYEATKTTAFTAYLENVAEGSAYPAVRANRFADAPVKWAPASDRESFEAVAAPLRQTVQSLTEENLTLAATRDALLPQLLSGKLQVNDAEKVLEDAL